MSQQQVDESVSNNLQYFSSVSINMIVTDIAVFQRLVAEPTSVENDQSTSTYFLR